MPALPAARAAVLSRLWGALAREPLPGAGAAVRTGSTLAVALPHGRTARGDAAAAQPFARPAAGLAVCVDGTAYTDPGELLAALGLPGTDGLRAELDNCVANLALARAGQVVDGGEPALARAAAQPDPLAYLEQSVVDGHPLHPTCRSRLGMSRDEVLAYAPEHRPTVALAVVDVPPVRWLGVNAPPRLLLHPWQVDHVLTRYSGLRDTGERVPARPLMSLRTLALVADPRQHVKTAVDVQMTSAVRTVSPSAVHNGPLMSTLLAGLGVPGLAVMPETASGAVLVDGEPCRSLAMVRRARPALAPDELALPLAVLSAPSPVDGRAIVTECAGDGDRTAFLTALVRVMVPPLLAVLARGVALEAHGQNLLVVLRAGRPHRLLYRDLGGVRVSPARLRSHGIDPPPLRGDLVTDDPGALRTKLFAALGTVLGELVATLAHEYHLDPAYLWGIIARAVHAAAPPGPDTTALLHDPMPIKATTAMRLAADPVADIWTYRPNPMGSTL